MPKTANFEKLAKDYIEYSIWFVHYGAGIFEEYKRKVRKSVIELEQDGDSRQGLFEKASQTIEYQGHPKENSSDVVNEICGTGSEHAFKLIKIIIALSPNDDQLLGFIGAGLFEDWIKNAKYKNFKSEIESLIETNKKWALVVKNSWYNPESLESKIMRDK
ncbi:MAG: hypothetical protein ABFQ62_03710 [Patescibacteria group bacterium]